MTKRFAAGLGVVIVAATAQLGGQSRLAEPPDPAREYSSFEGMLASLVREDARLRFADDALRSAPADPSTARLLFEVKRIPDALQSMEAATRGSVDITIEAMRVLGPALSISLRDNDPLRTYTDRAVAIVTPVRARIAALPREDAARLAWSFVRIDHELAVGAGNRSDFRARIAAFVQEYSGTKAALLAEVDLIEHGMDLRTKITALEEFWKAHPASEAGAKALYQKGWQLAHNAIGTIEPRGADPTERFLQIVAIADELGSGRYPESEWVQRAPQLVSGFYVSSSPPPKYQAGNVDRMVAEYQRLLRARFTVADDQGSSVRSVITSTIPNLHALQAIDRATSVERTLADLEASGADKRAVALFRAEFWASLATAGAESERPAWRPKAEAALGTLAGDGADFYARRAAASLAGMLLHQRDYARALAAFDAYATRFPASSFAWVAQVRGGQCLLELGKPDKAAEKFEAAASSAPHGELPHAIGSALAGSAYDRLGAFDRSLVAYRRALASWNYEFWRDMIPEPSQSRPPVTTGSAAPRLPVTRQHLADRVASLERNLATAPGPLLERAAIQIDARQLAEARVTLAAAVKQARSVDERAAVRRLEHRVQLEAAMDLLAVDATQPDVTRGLKALEAIAPDPFDAHVGFAGLLRAGVLFRNGADEHARVLMTATLDAWRDSQRGLRTAGPSSAVAADAAAIRNALLRPGGMFEMLAKKSVGALNHAATTGYLVVNPDVRILAANGIYSRVTVYQDFPELTNVVFWNSDEIALARRLSATLGGTGTRGSANADVRNFWNSFFVTRDANGGRWVEDTYPAIGTITFYDEARTKAVVAFRAGSYEGGTMLMEKKNGLWLAVKILSAWIS